MSEYHFAGSSYDSERDMCDAIAESWLSGDGANETGKMRGILFAETDEELADDCMLHWFADLGPEYSDEAPPKRDALVAAFFRLRRDFDKRLPGLL